MGILKRLLGRRKRSSADREEMPPICRWGRTIVQYRKIFLLDDADLRPGRRILDCAGGPASFTVEASALGARVTAIDPIYSAPATRLRAEIARAQESSRQYLTQSDDRYVWGRGLQSPEELLAVRRKSLEMFTDDFAKGAGAAGHYACGTLPRLPLRSGSFDLVLVGNLLFLYSKQLDTDFHCQSALELLRLAPEIRIFPVVAMGGKRSPHLEPVLETLRRAGASVEMRQTDYEHMKGGDKVLIVRH